MSKPITTKTRFYVLTEADFKKHMKYMYRSGGQDMVGCENFDTRFARVEKKLIKGVQKP